jgi:hypothetical protein
MVPSLPPLSEWENFYVITGSAGAALTGLQFVVIALRTEAISEGGEGAVRAFGTPTVLHLCGVLLLAAILTIPHQTVASLSLCIGATGAAGLVLSARVVFHARRQRAYRPVLSDWLWHVALPLAAYASVATAARLLWRWPALALDLVGAASLLLLFIGIHNAWDSAVWIAAGRHQAQR